MAGHSLSLFGAGIALTLLMLLAAHQVAGQPENYRSNRTALAQWIGNTNAHLTFVGAPRGAPFKPFDIQVIWCSEQMGRVCGGNCTIYTGVGDTCLLTQYTASCLAATDNLGYCSRQECRPPCNVYRKCGDPMDNGFCSTPYTNAINIMLITEDQSDAPKGTPSHAPASTEQSGRPTSSTVSGPPPSSATHIVTTIFVSSVASVSLDDGASKPKATLPVGMIVGVALGGLLGVIAVLLLVFWVRKHRRRMAAHQHSLSPEPFAAVGWAAVTSTLPAAQYLHPKTPTSGNLSTPAAATPPVWRDQFLQPKSRLSEMSRAHAIGDVNHEDSIGSSGDQIVEGRARHNPPPYTMV